MVVRRRPASLATRIVRLALAVGVVTIVAAVLVALVTVSSLGTTELGERENRALDVGRSSLEHDIVGISLVVDQAGALASAGGAGLSEQLDELLATSAEALESLYVADRTGKMIATSGSVNSEPDARRLPAFRAALVGRTGLLLVLAAEQEGGWEFWTTQPAVRRDGSLVFLLGKVNRRFIDDALGEASKEAPGQQLLLLSGRDVISSAGSNLDADHRSVSWIPEGASGGKVRVPGPNSILTGRYAVVHATETMQWRLVVVGETASRAKVTALALLPTLGVLLLGGAVALAMSWGLANGLARPLREMERAARKAAVGAYVRPLETTRDDELGRVGEAFNAVALRLNALHDVSQLLASASQLDQVLDGILAAMGNLVGPGAAAIYLLDEDATHFVPMRTRGRELAHAHPIDAMDAGWLNSALATEDPVAFTGDGAELARELPGFAGESVQAVAAPLLSGMEPLGVLVVVRDIEQPMADAEREMLRTFSAQAAVAVQTSRLFETESESRRIAEALRMVAEQLVKPESLPRALETVEHVVMDLFAAKGVSIVVIDKAVLGMSPSATEEHEVIAAAYRVLEQVSEGEAGVADRGQDKLVDAVLDRFDAEHLLVVPIGLETDHGAVMALALDSWQLGSRALAIGESLADEIALALDQAYFYQRALSRAANLETILRISQAVGSSLQINVVLNRVLDVVQKILSADAVVLMSYDERKRRLVTALGRGDVPRPVMDLELETGEDLPGQVFAKGAPVAVRDIHLGGSGILDLAASSGLHALLAVPLLARGRSIGVLIVFSSAPHAFSEEDMGVLQTFASQAALAIDTARLYSREHEVATVLQQSILPEALPEFPQLEVGSVYSPAGEDIEIGGDYYDMFRAENGVIWFAIADVCGKGVYAATKTSMIKYVVRALVVAGMSPSRIVTEANNMIAVQGDPSDIVTLWLGAYDPESRELRWANGGHPPALLRRADGTVVELAVTGALLGASEGAHYDELHLRLAPDDTIVLYTDGVIEARRGNTFFGVERIVDVLQAGGSTASLARQLLLDVQEYAEGMVRDDIAILVVRVKEDMSNEKGKPVE